MNLLEEGVATGNVLLTGRKEKHSIDNVTRDFDIYRIKYDFLFYNDQNDRIATWVSEYNSAQGADLLALGRDEYNDVIENFIVESNPAALRKTEKSVALRGQLRPGIVLNDGRVIDGNRRLTCIRRLARTNNEAGWFEAAILDDATGSDPKRIKLLELAIQIGEEEKVAYDPVDRLVGVYRDVVKSHLITPAEYGSATGMTEAEVKKLVDRAQYMEEFLEFCQAPEQYHLARALKVDGPLGEFGRVLKGTTISVINGSSNSLCSPTWWFSPRETSPDTLESSAAWRARARRPTSRLPSSRPCSSSLRRWGRRPLRARR